MLLFQRVRLEDVVVKGKNGGKGRLLDKGYDHPGPNHGAWA